MSRTVVSCCLLSIAGILVGCGSELEEPSRPAEPVSVGVEPSSFASDDPARWTCLRYGDIADESGDSYDSNAVQAAESFLIESVRAALRERGFAPESGDQTPTRWTGLLSDICMEWPDLLLEAAAIRVAEGLP